MVGSAQWREVVQWAQAGWQLLALHVKPRKRIRRRRPVGLPVGGLQAQHANHVWCLDFLKDTTRDRRPLRIFSIVDEHTRECLALLVARRFHAVDVVRALNRVRWVRGSPGHLRSDNGPECVASDVATWATEAGITLVHTAPGSPWENAFSKTFHSRLRDECLEREVFGSLEEAQVVCEAYRQWYNTVRPHSALGYQTPAACAAGVVTRNVVGLHVAGYPRDA